jgi:MFS family permease
MQEAHDPYGALRQRDYRRLLSSSVLYTLGIEMQAVAVGWELWLRTGSALALSFVGLAQFLPVLVLALPAGQAADRHDRKKLLMAAQGLAALTSLGLAAISFGEGPVEWMYLCLLMVGVARAFNVPARWALLPQVVPPHLLANAVTWNSSGFQIANVAGPALGGLVVATIIPAGTYFLTALCALCCVGLTSTLRTHKVAPPRETRSLQTLLAGIRFVWQTKPVLATITLDLFAVLLGGATALLPIFAKDILHAGAVGLGWLRAAPALGALVMGLVLAHHPPLRYAGKTLLAAVSGFGVATIVFGLSDYFPLSFAMLMVTGALDNISVVVRGTLVQTLTPEAMRGRVGAVNIIFVSSSNELGAFESGVTAHFFGPIASVVMGGYGTILVVFGVMALWPALIRLSLERPTKPNQELPAPPEETLAPPVEMP